MKTLVLFSSANHQGNTAQLVQQLAALTDMEVMNIDHLRITPYDYSNQYPSDDFYPLVEKMLAADNLIFASPVYWYTPTAPMKALFERLTELLDVERLKPKARALKNKRGFIAASSASSKLSPIFEDMFAYIFAYFDMIYVEKIHANCADGFNIDRQELQNFLAALNNN